jgi:protein-tyrosine-phosphatase
VILAMPREDLATIRRALAASLPGSTIERVRLIRFRARWRKRAPLNDDRRARRSGVLASASGGTGGTPRSLDVPTLKAYLSCMSDPERPFRVLLVCTGNTCRRPMADANVVRGIRRPGRVRSAGVSAWDGAPASDGARAVARKHGLDLEGHLSRRLTPALLAGQDLVLLMNPGDLLRVKALDPDGGAEVFGLADFGRARPEGVGVPDPYGGSPEAYEETLAHIEEHLRRVVPYIQAELREREVGARKPS